ncbi:MAG: hypothetical protein COX65_00440 [Elusimicrobia bacterium CG_4_10_14_0_2_um_filter_56_8]|nr:MAG: hypothetical protein AUJ51_11055 [Elusimicrobia bacterium CG1_02_56_21]PJA17836.1 MAG: hypothetical protein COX65_00440 [Elusimicrobia bacterium CG_4_10_14_0_2_um_filter_56_8]
MPKLKPTGFIAESISASQGRDVCRELFEGSPDAIFLADAETGIIIDANPAAAILTGRSVKELIGIHQTALHPPQKKEHSRKIFEQHITPDTTTPVGKRTEFVILKADGSEIPVEISGKPITINGRRIQQGYFRDITERKLAEERLRESEAKFKLITEKSIVGVYLIQDGVFKYVNPVFAKVFGYELSELVGRLSPKDLTLPEDSPLVEENLRRRLEGETEELNYSFRGLKKDGTSIYVEVFGSRTEYLGKPAVIGTLLDVTGRKHTEEALKAAHLQLLLANTGLERRVEERTAQLEELNKELEAFSYSAAHDLKAPLRRLNVFSEMLEKEAVPALNAETRDYLLNIRKSVTHMTKLVDGLLTLSTTGRKQLSLENTPLSALLNEVISEIKAENPDRNIEWSVQRLPTVKCDALMLKQVFTNLLGNAVKFTLGRSTPKVEITYRKKNNIHIIGVRDNGIGFNMDYYDKIFSVFQRLHKSADFPGTGIGLSIVKRIIARHGGRVWAESSPGQGAVFYFSIPAAP